MCCLGSVHVLLCATRSFQRGCPPTTNHPLQPIAPCPTAQSPNAAPPDSGNQERHSDPDEAQEESSDTPSPRRMLSCFLGCLGVLGLVRCTLGDARCILDGNTPPPKKQQQPPLLLFQRQPLPSKTPFCHPRTVSLSATVATLSVRTITEIAHCCVCHRGHPCPFRCIMPCAFSGDGDLLQVVVDSPVDGDGAVKRYSLPCEDRRSSSPNIRNCMKVHSLGPRTLPEKYREVRLGMCAFAQRMHQVSEGCSRSATAPRDVLERRTPGGWGAGARTPPEPIPSPPHPSPRVAHAPHKAMRCPHCGHRGIDWWLGGPGGGGGMTALATRRSGRLKIVTCPCRGSGRASRHPRAQQPPLGSVPRPPVRGCLPPLCGPDSEQ